jgi:hypothetical protein
MNKSTENTGTCDIAPLTLAAAAGSITLGAQRSLPTQHSASYILACLRSVCSDKVAAAFRALDDNLAIHQRLEDRE